MDEVSYRGAMLAPKNKKGDNEKKNVANLMNSPTLFINLTSLYENEKP
jgi:hypothetical protein